MLTWFPSFFRTSPCEPWSWWFLLLWDRHSCDRQAGPSVLSGAIATQNQPPQRANGPRRAFSQTLASVPCTLILLGRHCGMWVEIPSLHRQDGFLGAVPGREGAYYSMVPAKAVSLLGNTEARCGSLATAKCSDTRAKMVPRPPKQDTLNLTSFWSFLSLV